MKKKKKKKLPQPTLSNVEEYINTLEKVADDETKTTSKPLNVSHKKSPRIILNSSGKITEIKVSASLMKKILYKGDPIIVCPYYIYRVWLLRDISEATTESMERGLYFETMCIGCSANNEGTYDLPRSKVSGDRLTAQIRIDDAVNRFHRENEKYGIIIDKEYIQYHAERVWEDKYKKFNDITIIIQGEIDFLSPIKYAEINHTAAVFDLKLTGDRDNCFPPFCWGCPEEMDLIQGVLYSNLMRLPFIYYVFDYRKHNPGHRLLPVKTIITHPQDQEAINRNNELDQSIRKTVSSIQLWEAEGWNKEPDVKVCKKCPIQCNEWKQVKNI